MRSSFHLGTTGRVLLLGATALVGRTQPLDPAFNPDINGEIYTIAAQPDGKLLTGGNFTAVGATARSRLARLNADGSIDAAFNVVLNSTVWTTGLQPDGKILVGGAFTAAGPTLRSRLVRLNADGSIDATFTAEANNTVRAIAVQPDGKILVAGLFSVIAGASRNGLARLNADGSIDPSFDVAISGTLLVPTFMVEGVVLQPDGRILVCGNFNAVSGQPRTAIARLLPSGVLDLSFVPPTLNSNMRTMIVLPTGKIFLAGNFSRPAVAPALTYTARLNADGSLDATFTPPTLNGSATGAALQADGRIVVGGFFTTANGVNYGSLIRLEANGTLDPSFAPAVSGTLNPNGSPNVNVVVIPPGPPHFVVGGAFTTVSGQSRNAIARFGTPLPLLDVPPASVIGREGSPVTLSVAATGQDLRFQWKRNGVDVPGATSNALPLDSLRTANSGIYTVAVSNAFGTVTSAPASVSIGEPLLPGYTFSTLAGLAGTSGVADGTGAGARFSNPTSLALDAAGNVYVTDSNGLRRIAANGAVTTVTTAAVRAIAIDASGNLYGHSLGQIRRISSTGIVTVLAGSQVPGFRDGTGAAAQFGTDLRGTAIDRDGNLLVVDNRNLAIRKITPAGVVTTVATFDIHSAFLSPEALTIDANGTLFFTDDFLGGIARVTPPGAPSIVSPNLTVTLENRPNQGERLSGIAVDTAGNLFVVDALNHVIRRVTAQGAITTIGGARGSRGSADGIGAAAQFSGPFGIAIDAAGTLYIADNGNHTIRKGVPETVPLSVAIPPQGTHTTAGNPVTLAVTSHGSALRFQWKKDGVPIEGATNAAYHLARPTGADMGYYSVVVRSGGTSLESNAAILTVQTPGATGRLINVATRGLVPAGGALTPGFVLRGSGTKQLVVRGAGPTLLNFGLGGALNDPRLELAPLGGAALLVNDDWGTASPTLRDASAAVGAFPLGAGSKDAATLATVDIALNRAYTVSITGHDAAATGLALAEVYDADPPTSSAQLTNVSTRGFVGAGASALVPGFVIGGSGPLQLLIRAVGPGLAPFGVTGLLADPQIAVVPLGRNATVAANDNWGGTAELSATFAAAGAFALPLDSKDAALLVRLPPGAYTVVVTGVGATTGNALVEIYDLP